MCENQIIINILPEQNKIWITHYLSLGKEYPFDGTKESVKKAINAYLDTTEDYM